MILSPTSILKELAYVSENNHDIVDVLDHANALLEDATDTQYNKVTEHLRLEILDVEKFVKVNECKQVSDPRPFIRDNISSPEGLLSDEIFGLTKEERAGTFAYIDLHGYFIDPSCFKAWIRIDNKIRNVVHGIGTYRVNDRGEIVEDPTGKTGIEFLRKNLDKIKFKSTSSIKRDIKVNYLEKNRNRMFIKKFIVIPAYYRDKNTGRATIGLGGINKLYNNLIIASNALQTTTDYMFDPSESMRGRVQEIILSIYDWFCGNNNPNITVDTGAGLSGKFGILRRTNMSKTADFASRLVISACNLKAERPEDMMVDFDRAAMPLAAAIADFRDFVTFHVKRFFENEFANRDQYSVINKRGKLEHVNLVNPELAFSDERIRDEMERFLHGYNNRFVTVEIPIEGTEDKYYMQFKGRFNEPRDAKEDNPESIFQRRLTWCDVFFISCTEAIKNKNILVTRFPIDKYANQVTMGLRLSSTKQTEPMYFRGEYYPYYPKIREKDIGSNTSDVFIDTMQFSNLYLPGMGGDFDGVA